MKMQKGDQVSLKMVQESKMHIKMLTNSCEEKVYAKMPTNGPANGAGK